MKGILEFDLPEDFQDHETAINANKYKYCLRQVADLLRSYKKYGLPDDLRLEDLVEHLHSEFWEIVSSENLNLD